MVRISLKTITKHKKKIIQIIKRIIKATVVAAIFYAAVIFPLSLAYGFLAGLVPVPLLDNVMPFLWAYWALTVISVLVGGTVAEPFISFLRALLPIAATLSTMNYAVITIQVEEVTVSVNLQTVLIIVLMISLIGVARAAVQTLSFIYRRVA